MLTELEKFINPPTNILEDSIQYFFLKQGDLSVSQYQADAERLIEKVIPEFKNDKKITHQEVKELLLRNLLLVGLRNRDVFKDCQKLAKEECTSSKILEIAYQAEYRESANKRLAKTVTTANIKSALEEVSAEVHINKIAKRPENKPMRKKTCRWCGGPQWCKKNECPAKDVICPQCKIKGHIGDVCRGAKKKYQAPKSTHRKPDRKPKRVHHVDHTDDSSDEDQESPLFTFNHLTHDVHSLSQAEVQIKPLWFSTDLLTKETHKVDVEIDSGAGCNVMPEYLYRSIFGKTAPKPSQARIRAYGGVKVPVLGKCSVYIHTADGKCTEAEFEISSPKGHPILGRETSRAIGYVEFPEVEEPPLEDKPIEHMVKSLKIEVKIPKLQGGTPGGITIDGVTHPLPLTKGYIDTEFKDVFDGLGDLPGGEYNLKLKEGATPVQHAPRQVPEKKKMAYKAELDRLVREQVIVKQDGHTEWVNSIVPAVKADGSIRLCLDPKDLNSNLERNPYYMKTIDELQGELKGSKIYTVIDAKQGYWHVKLDHESSLLTTFNTPWGKYRFIRLPFGLKVSGDVFQQRLDAVLAQLEKVTGIADDTLIHGSSERQHDIALLMLLQAARLNGIKFNSKKMQFRKTKVKFYGQTITPEGMQLDDSHVEAIQKMEAPKDKATLQSFLGLVNYMKRYTKELTKLCHPLRDLVKSKTIFSWETQHQKAFESVKAELMSTPTLAFYDETKQHTIQTDASLKGLGAVLLQEGKPVIYASRSLLPAEERYSNIERELLGMVFGLERLHNLIFGGPIEIQTDHQPLVNIVNKQVCDVSPRLQRLLLRVHKYDIKVKYIKGAENQVADALSRVTPLPPKPEDVRPDDLIPLNTLTTGIPASQSCLDRVRESTGKDPSLQQVAQYAHHGWPLNRSECDPRAIEYWSSRDDISLEDGLLFRGIQMIIPEKERSHFLSMLHEAHMGEEKSLLLARTSIYWPNYTEDIKQKVQGCDHCQSTRPSQPKETLLPHEIPSGPWVRLGIDYFDWNGSKYLLIADYYSRFPILRSVTNMTATNLVTTLKTVFSEYGIPHELVSDQGTQFTSEQYREFAKAYNIKVIHSSPRYPQSNGFIEAMVKVVKQTLERCKLSGTDPHLALLMYRATPLKSGVASPAELLNQRRYQTILPMKQRLSEQQQSSKFNMEVRKQKMADQYNQKTANYRELNLQEPVRAQLNPDVARWTKATIVKTPTKSNPRSYEVQLPSGQRFIRNRRYLRPHQGEITEVQMSTNPPEVPSEGPMSHTKPQCVTAPESPTQMCRERTLAPKPSTPDTRPRRSVIPPKRLIETM